MNRPFGLHGPEFEAFLYASVGEEGNGMRLSVLSTLARCDLDPWKEAIELAALPVDAAARRLASLIARLPGMAGRPEAGGAAHRLVLLLPKRTSPIPPWSGTSIGNALGLAKSSFVLWMIVTGLIVGAQAIQASRQPSAQTRQTTESAPMSVPSTKGPPPSSAQ